MPTNVVTISCRIYLPASTSCYATVLSRTFSRRRQMRCMKKKSISQSSNFRAATDLFICLAGVLAALFAFAAPTVPLQAQGLGHQRNKSFDAVKIVTPVSSGTWTVTGSLNAGRFEHTATLLL